MSKIPKSLLWIVLIAFTLLTAYVIQRIGLWNVWVHNLNHPAGWQIFADISIALALVITWIWKDARAQGRSPWPWLAITLTIGSFGPLLYLLIRARQPSTADIGVAQRQGA
jgi:hypothetical protein